MSLAIGFLLFAIVFLDALIVVRWACRYCGGRNESDKSAIWSLLGRCAHCGKRR